jgi:hypothetical protein
MWYAYVVFIPSIPSTGRGCVALAIASDLRDLDWAEITEASSSSSSTGSTTNQDSIQDSVASVDSIDSIGSIETNPDMIKVLQVVKREWSGPINLYTRNCQDFSRFVGELVRS